MRVADFSFELPESLIAHYPQAERSACRLLQLDGPSGALTHGVFTDLLDKLEAGDLLVFNNTRVIPARMFGRKVSGGKIEVLVERVLDDHRVLAHVRASKAPKPGAELLLGMTSIAATMVARHETLFELRFNDERDVFTILNAAGHMPLPPYIARPDEDADRELYQTVYSEKPGAVAAPTAGLHFDELLLGAARQGRRNGVRDAARRRWHLPAGARGNHRRSCDARRIRRSAAGRGRCGAGLQGARQTRRGGGYHLGAFAGKCRGGQQRGADCAVLRRHQHFIYPGYHYQVIDALVTNFHLPESTLIMLVSAFAGYKNTMNAYQQAVAEQYRFFSYGDAMFISRNPQAENESVGG